MRKFLLLVLVCIAANYYSEAQNLSYTCPRNVTVSCGPPCITLNAKFPDIRALGDDYTFTNSTVAVPCYPIVDPGGPGPSTNLVIDDRYSAVIPIGFTFPFYGVNYTSLVVSTNGYISFDISKTGLFSHYGILNSGGTLSATSGVPQGSAEQFI